MALIVEYFTRQSQIQQASNLFTVIFIFHFLPYGIQPLVDLYGHPQQSVFSHR